MKASEVLTPRQMAVYRLRKEGLDYREIGERLKITRVAAWYRAQGVRRKVAVYPELAEEIDVSVLP